MKALLVLSLMTSCLIFSINSHAAVSVGGTRLVFHGDEKEASITVSNTDKGIPVLI
ncbi:TPA: molecular chaperone, partial [Klebsiella pneumoniae]|nr:molecular chaperone [Klebsiella pneumoniae]